MKLLFVSLYSDTPHFETELELASALLDDGHDVFVLRCTGQLGACLKNPEHKAGRCRLCVSKIDAGLRAIASPRLHVEELRAVAIDPRLPSAFESADELKLYALDGANLGRGVYSTMCGRANKDTRFDPRVHAAAIRTELEAAYTVYANVKDAIARHAPDRAYVFNGRFATCFAAVEACRVAGITYCTHERGGTPDRYLVREDALPHDLGVNHAEIVRAWGAGGRAISSFARRWYRERRDGVERSWESFTKAQTVGKLPDGFAGGRRNIAVFNSTMEEYASIVSWESPHYRDEVVGLRRIVEDLGTRRDVHLYLRVHPHMKHIRRDDNYQLREYAELARAAPNLTIIWPESVVHTYALVDACDVTLTFGSTVGAEACFWQSPSVLAGRALYEHLDCAYVATDHDDVVRLLLADHGAKPELGALKYGYWETMRGTRFTRFAPTGLYTGAFLGRPNRASLAARVESAELTRLGR
jgi:hypothetical protein